MQRYLPEASILKAKDPAVVEDNWPIFVLNDAIVYRPDGVTMANAVLVAQEGPCIVRGHLEIEDKEDFQYLVKPSVRSAFIEAKDIENYSIGDDPQGVIWIASGAGWLEINPHPSYEPIYRSMCEMTVLYYVLLGIYLKAAEAEPKNANKILSTLDTKEVLFEYAVAVGDGTTYDETVDKCVRLGPMLLAHFARSTDLDWARTSFYKWLTRELKSRERSARSSSRGESAAPAQAAPSQGPAATPIPPPQLPNHSSSSIVPQQLPFRAPPEAMPAVETPIPLPPHAAHGFSTAAAVTPSVTPVPAPSPLPAPAQSQAESSVPSELRASILSTYLAIIEDLGTEFGNPANMSPGKVHYGLFRNYRVRSYNMGKHLSSLFSRELVEQLSDRWHGSPYEKWLTSAEARQFCPSSGHFLADVPEQLIRRAHQAPTASGAAAAAATPLSKSNSPAPSPRPAGKRAVLRPLTASKKRRLDAADHGDSGDTDGEVASQGSTRRPVGRPRKLARSGHDDGPPSGAGHASQAMQLDSDEDDSDVDDDDNDDDDDAPGSSLRDETVLAVHSEPLLVSTKPTGPNRTWTCPEPHCDFFVRGAAAADAEGEDDDEDNDEDDRDEYVREAAARIRAHLKGHEEEMLSRVDLAISEGTRGHVSVDHLLAKIRTLAEKKTAWSSTTAAATTGPDVSSGTNGRSRFLF